MLHKHYSKQAPPSQEGGPMQFLKLTEGEKLSPELLIISCKFQLQPELQAIPLQPKQISCLCVHWFT